MENENETGRTLNCFPLDQSDPFGNGNDAMISEFIGRFCGGSEEISPVTLHSFPIDSQISENFPISGGIRFPYPSHFGSDRTIRVLGSQQTAQESNKSSLLDPDSFSPEKASPSTGLNSSRKRKSTSTANGKESPASSSLTASNSKISEDNGASSAVKKSKQDQAAITKHGNVKNEKEGSKDNAKPPEPPKDYIHVRARRGQATDSHSLAERARREKISERMKLLQDLVPGCNRITGKALMLDEIINYVQSLQRQVEFLSMKLAALNPRMEFNANALLSTEMFQLGESMSPNFYPIASSEPKLQSECVLLTKGMPRFAETQLQLNPLGVPLSLNDEYVQACAQTEAPVFWGNDLQSIVQMGFGDSQPQNINCSEPVVQMKVEP